MAVEPEKNQCTHNDQPILISPVRKGGYATVLDLQEPGYKVKKPFVIKVERVRDHDQNLVTLVSIPRLDGSGQADVYADGQNLSQALVELKCLTLSYHRDLTPPDTTTQTGPALDLARFLNRHIVTTNPYLSK